MKEVALAPCPIEYRGLSAPKQAHLIDIDKTVQGILDKLSKHAQTCTDIRTNFKGLKDPKKSHRMYLSLLKTSLKHNGIRHNIEVISSYKGFWPFVYREYTYKIIATNYKDHKHY